MSVGAVRRSARGNILGLTLAVLGFAVFAVGYWILSSTRLMGSHQEQKTAIEAAALAAAGDLSTIVMEDPNFGFVSLSDRSPIGTATAAGDNFFTSVQSINILLATVRLNMIIADQMNDATMKTLAQQDYANVIKAQSNLVALLQQAIAPSGFGLDYNNNKVQPYNDAVTAYQKDSIRMNGGKSALVPGSLKLTLGLAPGLITTTVVPLPASTVGVSTSQQDQGFYRAFTDVPYNGYDFVFAAGSADAGLVDATQFSTSKGALPYAITDVVKCDADQQMTYKGEDNKDAVAITHVNAAAEPGILVDQTPDPGAFEISFASGLFPEISKPGDVFLYAGLINSPVDRLQMPLTGDYPATPLSDYYLPIVNDDHPMIGKVLSFALYDWLKRGRGRINVNSLMTILNSPLQSTIPATLPQKHQFMMQPDGTISYAVVPDNPAMAEAVSENQIRATSGMAIFSSNTYIYDFYLRDFGFQPGRLKGGMHAGEPLNAPGPTVPGGGSGKPLDENPTVTSIFATGPGGGAVRPTYQTMGTALQIRFKSRANFGNLGP